MIILHLSLCLGVSSNLVSKRWFWHTEYVVIPDTADSSLECIGNLAENRFLRLAEFWLRFVPLTTLLHSILTLRLDNIICGSPYPLLSCILVAHFHVLSISILFALVHKGGILNSNSTILSLLLILHLEI